MSKQTKLKFTEGIEYGAEFEATQVGAPNEFYQLWVIRIGEGYGRSIRQLGNSIEVFTDTCDWKQLCSVEDGLAAAVSLLYGVPVTLKQDPDHEQDDS